MSDTLRLMENEVQLAALAFMVVVYVLRVVWLMRFRRTRERTFAEGRASRGAGLSLMNIALPWAMESTRRKPLFYLQFVIFHLGVTAAITATFIIPYNPEFFENPVAVRGFQAIIGAAFFVGLYRLWRRLRDPRIRAISTPDDYASLILMIAYFAAGILAVPNDAARSEAPLLIFFGLTALFLVYVPFSKIGHYLYYPFARVFLGRALGHRGVLPASRRRKDKTDEA